MLQSADYTGLVWFSYPGPTTTPDDDDNDRGSNVCNSALCVNSADITEQSWVSQHGQCQCLDNA